MSDSQENNPAKRSAPRTTPEAGKESKRISPSTTAQSIGAGVQAGTVQQEAPRGSRTHRTGHQQQREQNEAELTKQWKEKINAPLQLGLDDSLPGFQAIEDKSASEVVDIYIGAGAPTGFVLDDCRTVFELDHDLSHIVAPKTSLIAHAARDFIADSIGREPIAISLKALLLLDDESSKATPSWRLRFERQLVSQEKIAEIESGLHSVMEHAASDSDEIWAKPADKSSPDEGECEKILKRIVGVAQDLRKSAGGKAIAADSYISSDDFKAPIKLPTKMGARPEPDEKDGVTIEKGEVVGFDRNERRVFVKFDGGKASAALRADMETFKNLAVKLADMEGNVCRIDYKPEQKTTEKICGTLTRLEVLSSGLHAEMPAITVAPPDADGEASQITGS